LLVLRAGFPVQDVPNFSTPHEFWSLVVKAATDGKLSGGVQSVVDRAIEQYPNHAFFTSFTTHGHNDVSVVAADAATESHRSPGSQRPQSGRPKKLLFDTFKVTLGLAVGVVLANLRLQDDLVQGNDSRGSAASRPEESHPSVDLEPQRSGAGGESHHSIQSCLECRRAIGASVIQPCAATLEKLSFDIELIDKKSDWKLLGTQLQEKCGPVLLHLEGR